MTSSADATRRADGGALPDDFLGFTLAGGQLPEGEREGRCAGGNLRWRWHGEGLLEFEPVERNRATEAAGRDAPRERPAVLASAGVHGDETAPIELLTRLAADLAGGRAALACRLLLVLGNPAAMRAARRYLDDDLNRLFGGAHAQRAGSREAPRAAALEAATRHFFATAQAAGTPRWHVDMHTAIRTSVFERFALLPCTGAPPARAMLDWLRAARIDAVLLHTERSHTYTSFTGEACGALACTLELGKVRPFGQNDLARFAGADAALRALIAGQGGGQGAADIEAPAAAPRVFTVIDQIVKRSDAFELLLDADVPNFTAFPRGTVLARDGDYRYVVRHDEERIVFPNARVKPGLRAGLLVIEGDGASLS